MNIVVILGTIAIWGPVEAFPEGTPADMTWEAQNAPVRLDAGERAPFDGLLVPIKLAASLMAKVESCDQRIELVRQERTELAELEVDFCRNLREADQESHAMRVQVLEQALAEAVPAWWEHPAVWLGVGIVGAIALVAGSVSILGATRPMSANLQSATH